MNSNTDFTLEFLNQASLDLSYPSSVIESSLNEDEKYSDLFLPFENTNNNLSINEIALPTPDYTNAVAANNTQMENASIIPEGILSTPLPTPNNYTTPSMYPNNDELEEFLTPLVSPAIAPNFTDLYQFLDSPNNEQFFTPLNSPALLPNIETPINFTLNANINTNSNTVDVNPTNLDQDISQGISPVNNNDTAVLAQQLVQIEAKQQQLRDQMRYSPAMSPTYRKSPLSLYTSRTSNPPPSPLAFNVTKKRPSLRQKIALASPKLQASPTTPATPASLMKIGHIPQATMPPSNTSDKTVVDIMPSLPPPVVPAIPSEPQEITKKRKLASASPIPIASSPRTLRPLISPFLQPINNDTLPSNISSPALESRRSAHKVAEQRRRDTLKQSFDSLRKEIVDVLIAESGKTEEMAREEKEKEVKLMSKVLLLQHSYEYIVRLKSDTRKKDEKIKYMQDEIDKLKKLVEEQPNPEN